MKWWYGIAAMDDGKSTVSNHVMMARSNSAEEATGIAMSDPAIADLTNRGFRINKVNFYEIPADTVRQMAIDYGILPEGGGN